MRVSCYEKTLGLLLLSNNFSEEIEQTDFVFSHTQFFCLVMFGLGPGRTQFIVMSVWTNHSGGVPWDVSDSFSICCGENLPHNI
jgi:hypothetical protein